MSIFSEKTGSVVRSAASILEDQGKLAYLEWRYESAYWRRRILVLAVGCLLILTADIYFQVSLYQALIRAGLSPAWVAIGLAVLHAGLGALILKYGGRRDPEAGAPFKGTLEESERNLKWIQQHFS